MLFSGRTFIHLRAHRTNKPSRCAVHYKAVASENHTLLHQLLKTEVYKSNGIRRNIALSLEGFDTTIEGAKGRFHFEDDQTQFRVYVPKDNHGRELCYLHEIPKKLVAHLSISDPVAVKVIGNVIQASTSSVLDELLDEHGIVPVPEIASVTAQMPEEPPSLANTETPVDQAYHAGQAVLREARPLPHTPSREPSRASSSSLYDSETSRGRPTISSLSTPTFSSPGSRLSSDRSAHRRDHVPFPASTITSSTSNLSPNPKFLGQNFQRSLSSASVGDSETPRVSLFPVTSGESEVSQSFSSIPKDNYRDLLHKVIMAAARGGLPSFVPTASVIGLVAEHIPDSDHIFGSRSADQLSHDIHVGAAGELYVGIVPIHSDTA